MGEVGVAGEVKTVVFWRLASFRITRARFKEEFPNDSSSTSILQMQSPFSNNEDVYSI